MLCFEIVQVSFKLIIPSSFKPWIIPFDEFIEQEVGKHSIVKLLMSMPAVGPITALTVMAEVGDFARFPTAEKLTKFAGLTPRQRSSGGMIKFGSITHQGSPLLRTVLVETAMRIREGSTPELFAFIARITPTSGAKRARVALARKMLAIMWTIVKNNTPYVPQPLPTQFAQHAHE